jgi:hypothetical protein
MQLILVYLCEIIFKQNESKMKRKIIIVIGIFLAGCASQQNLTSEKEIITTTPEQINTKLEFELITGKYHNHPSFAIWIEDLEGNYIETLYVTQYFAKGIFGYGEAEPGKWKNEPGNVRRPAALPYWSHKRNIKASDGLYVPSPETSVPDALTGATPKGNFALKTGTKVAGDIMFRVLLEINQPWDSNDYWTNNKYPDDFNYKSSLQPGLVYAVTISPDSPKKVYYLNPIGHSHYSGETGELFSDLTTITTAREIFSKIAVTIK